MMYLNLFLKILMVVMVISYMLFSIYNIDYDTQNVDFSDDIEVDSRFRIFRQYKLLEKLYKSNKSEVSPRKKLINSIIIGVFITIIILCIPLNNVIEFFFIFLTLFSYYVYRVYKDKTGNIVVKYILPLYIICYGLYSIYKIFVYGW